MPISNRLWTIGDWQRLVAYVYAGKRLRRIDPVTLNVMLVGRFHNVLVGRRTHDHKLLAQGLAESTLVLLALAVRCRMRLDQALATKWPGVCSYCLQAVGCQCVDRHGSLRSLRQARSALVFAPLDTYQTMLGQTFGDSNQAQGPITVSLHCFEEITEIVKPLLILSEGTHSPEATARRKREIWLEQGDVLAWLIAIANLHQLRLDALLHRYLKGRCPKCWQKRCRYTSRCLLYVGPHLRGRT